MSRKSFGEKIAKADPIYCNRLINMLVNCILKNGKKSIAYRILYRAKENIKRRTKKNPLFVLRQAISKVTPNMTVKGHRKGGSTYHIPLEIQSTQGKALAIRWLLGAALKHSGGNMAAKLSYELIDAAKDIGIAVRKKSQKVFVRHNCVVLLHFK